VADEGFLVSRLRRADCGGGGAAAPASAADLFGTAPPLTYPATQGPTAVEVGSNWYVRGDLGISFDDAPTISLSSISTPPPGYYGASLPVYAGTDMHSTDFTGGVGFGIASTTICASTRPGTIAPAPGERARRPSFAPMPLVD